MNYNEFYKKAETTETPKPGAQSKTTPRETKKPFGVQDYRNQLPMLALLAGTGALGGYALSNRKKKGAGALYGGLSLPALYLTYLYGRRNGWIGDAAKANAFDTWTNSWINDPVNDLFSGKAETREAEEKPKTGQEPPK